MKSKHIPIVTLLAFAAFTQRGNAQYAGQWINSGTGNWSDSSNWGLSTVPTYAMWTEVRNGTAVIASGSATAGQIYIGGAGTGAIQISGPASLQTFGPFAVIGQNGTGSVSLSHTDASWTYRGSMHVGYGSGTGSLSITAGSVQASENGANNVLIGAAGGNGILTISGSSSSLATGYGSIYVGGGGDNGHAQMSITAGGQASSGYGWVGANPGSVGIAEVSGSGSRWNIDESLHVASSASGSFGSLTISSGGKITTGGQVFLGLYAQGSIMVTGEGSQLITGTGASSGERGSIFMGASHVPGGNATLTVADGGVVRASSAAYPSYTRTLYLTDSNSNVSSQATLQIGTGGRAGTVDDAIIVNGGSGIAKVIFNHSDAAYNFAPLIVGSTNIEQVGSGTTILAGNNGYAGTTKISSGTLAASSISNFGWTGSITIDSGRLRADNSIDFGTGSVPYGGRLFHLTGAAEIHTTAAATTVTIDRTVDGNGSLTKSGLGKLILSGAATQTGGTTIAQGTLQIGSGGTTGSIAGNITNDGNLIFNRSDSFSYAGEISGIGNLTKLGAGVLTLSGNQSYTGSTFLQDGTLVVNGTFGVGGQISVNTATTLGGNGTVDRDIYVYSGGTLSSSLNVTGQVTLANQQSVGAVSGGTQTAASGQQLVVSTATGGIVNTSAGTASIGTLDGATVNTGNWGATVTNLTSGSVNTNGGSLVAQQGDFNGSISGNGGLTKTGSGTLTLNSLNSYTGGTIVRDGTLQVAIGTATGSAPIRLVNNGRFRAMGGVNVSTGIIAENGDTTYEKIFNPSENLANFGSFSSNMDGKDSTALIAAGTTGIATTTVSTHFSASSPSDYLLSDRLTIDGLDGTTFLLVMDSLVDIPVNADLQQIFLGWFDTGDSTWENAVEGNHGPNGTDAGGYHLSYQEFLSSKGGWNAASMLGAYGIDTTNNQVWAVIDHNSDFATVPEPGTCTLLGLGFSALLFRRRSRSSAP